MEAYGEYGKSMKSTDNIRKIYANLIRLVERMQKPMESIDSIWSPIENYKEYIEIFGNYGKEVENMSILMNNIWKQGISFFS